MRRYIGIETDIFIGFFGLEMIYILVIPENLILVVNFVGWSILFYMYFRLFWKCGKILIGLIISFWRTAVAA
jgi:hypothetical protein